MSSSSCLSAVIIIIFCSSFRSPPSSSISDFATFPCSFLVDYHLQHLLSSLSSTVTSSPASRSFSSSAPLFQWLPGSQVVDAFFSLQQHQSPFEAATGHGSHHFALLRCSLLWVFVSGEFQATVSGFYHIWSSRFHEIDCFCF